VRKKGELQFLKLTDRIILDIFDKKLLKLFGMTENTNQISNMLAAFIKPKCLIEEIKKAEGDFQKLYP